MRLAWVLLALVLVGCALSQRGRREPEVRISIAIPRYGNALAASPAGARRVSRDGYDDQFPVVIENRSSRPLEFLVDGSSWGDVTLSFEITWSNGKTAIAKKEVMGYTKNTPSTVRLDPGECWVRTINFDRPTWVGFPKPASGTPIPVTMRAILRQSNQGFETNKGIWAGQATSAPIKAEWWGR